MGFEIAYPVGKRPTDAQILRQLREQYPGRQFAIGPGNTIVESYLEQPTHFEQPFGLRAAKSAGVRAVAEVVEPAPSYLERTMSGDL
jgi:hypothetical protein